MNSTNQFGANVKTNKSGGGGGGMMAMGLVALVLIGVAVWYFFFRTKTGCMTPGYKEYDEKFEEDTDPSGCETKVGCKTPGFTEYDVDNKEDTTPTSCETPVAVVKEGCTDDTATNRTTGANKDDGSCTYNKLFNFKSAGASPADQKCLNFHSDDVLYYENAQERMGSSCTAFNIIADKDGKIADTAQEITISDPTEGKDCAKWVQSILGSVERAACSPGDDTTNFVAVNQSLNINVPSHRLNSDKPTLHTLSSGQVTNKVVWAGTNPEVTGSFVIQDE